MPEKNNPLIFFNEPPVRQAYTSPQSGGGQGRIPPRDRASHSQRLIQNLNEAFAEAALEKDGRAAMALSAREGKYLVFESHPDFELLTKSIESIRKGIRLLSVREDVINGQKVKFANVFVPKGQESFFLEKLRAYAEENTPLNGNPKHDPLIRSIEKIKLAVTSSFWQSNQDLFPENDPVWCEAWLRVEQKAILPEVLEGFRQVCQRLGITSKENQVLRFPERAIVLIQASQSQLKELIASTDLLAEFRRAQETARFWMNVSPFEQAEWVQELLDRMQVNPSDVSICILDTGINNGHPLLDAVLADEDCQAWLSDWGGNDHNGHGTLMAGVAIFGDLEKHLSHSLPVVIEHRLESVKVLPPIGINDPNLYGAITMDAISLAEIQAPQRKRVFALAIGSKVDAGNGKPSSWSGAVDQIAFGADDTPHYRIKRLVFIAAGNTDESELDNYPNASQSTSVESPGQSWNALTIGAYTKKNQITDPSLLGWTIVAPYGGLSPFSTTSLNWDKKWAVKPDVVFEGGNAMIDESNFASECDDLSLLSTYYQPQSQSFNTFNKTSAATAQAVWFAAQIMKAYPDTWAETVRALIVHSANWSDIMRENFLSGSQKGDYRILLRTCGYGVPDLQKATTCLNNSLTLIAQERIQPFTKKNNRYISNEMHLFQLPWPTEILRELGEMKVTLRITLSYFIDPSPGEIGWKDKYRYPSHGLRFDINTSVENRDGFIRRINAAIREDEESTGYSSPNVSQRWVLGPQNRDVGSIHSDYWISIAAELASCNMVAVYPTIGWWRERSHLNKWNSWTRYSLIISLETADESVPIYETVANLIRTKVEVQVGMI